MPLAPHYHINACRDVFPHVRLHCSCCCWVWEHTVVFRQAHLRKICVRVQTTMPNDVLESTLMHASLRLPLRLTQVNTGVCPGPLTQLKACFPFSSMGWPYIYLVHSSRFSSLELRPSRLRMYGLLNVTYFPPDCPPQSEEADGWMDPDSPQVLSAARKCILFL